MGYEELVPWGIYKRGICLFMFQMFNITCHPYLFRTTEFWVLFFFLGGGGDVITKQPRYFRAENGEFDIPLARNILELNKLNIRTRGTKTIWIWGFHGRLYFGWIYSGSIRTWGFVAPSCIPGCRWSLLGVAKLTGFKKVSCLLGSMSSKGLVSSIVYVPLLCNETWNNDIWYIVDSQDTVISTKSNYTYCMFATLPQTWKKSRFFLLNKKSYSN